MANLDVETKRVVSRFEVRNNSNIKSIEDLEFNSKSLEGLVKISDQNEYAGKLKPHIADIIEIAKQINEGKYKSKEYFALAILNYLAKYEADSSINVNITSLCSESCLGLKDTSYLEETIKHLRSPKEINRHDWTLRSNEDFPNEPYFENKDGIRFYQNPKRFVIGDQFFKTSEGWKLTTEKDDGFLNDQQTLINVNSGIYFVPKEKLYYDPKENKTFDKNPAIESAIIETGAGDLAGSEDYAMPDSSETHSAKDEKRFWNMAGVTSAKFGNELHAEVSRPSANTQTKKEAQIVDLKPEERRVAESNRAETIEQFPKDLLDEMKEMLAKLRNSGYYNADEVAPLTKIIGRVERGEDFKSEDIAEARRILERAEIKLSIASGLEHRAAETVTSATEEVGKAEKEIAGTLPALAEVYEATMKRGLESLGVLGIPPEEIEDIIDKDKILKSMGYIDPTKVRQLTHTPFPMEYVKSKNSWGEKMRSLFDSGKKKVTLFTEALKQRVVGNEAKIGAGAATVAVLLLALLTPNPQKEKVSAEKPAISDTNTEKPVATPAPAAEPTPTNISDEKIEVPKATRITDEMRKECQQGKYTQMIKCIRSVVEGQKGNLKSELVNKINQAAQERAEKEGKVWNKLSEKDKHAYVDAILGGDVNSPSGKIAKELNLGISTYKFDFGELEKQGVKVTMPKSPDYVPVDMVIKFINELK